MKPPQLLLKILLTGFILLAFCLPASAAITLYDTEGTTFKVDGFFNTFYANSDVKSDFGADRQQSRVKMGFLPNYIGFDFSKQVGDLKLGGRSSFWVSINDSDDSSSAGDSKVTDTGIDVRQFYATVDGAFGQVLLGKDFTLFNRSNIFLDEILTGFGNVSDFLGLVDGGGVSFGNIGSGYTYPTPSAQITYRTPNMGGFKLAVGLIDPSHTSAATDAEENVPRIEAEATFSKTIGQVALTTWLGFLSQQSESASGAAGDVNSSGISYGLNAKLAGFSLTGSGFTAEGVGLLTGPAADTALGLPLIDSTGQEIDSDGFLIQGSYIINKVRLVASYGKNEYNINGNSAPDSLEDETVTGAVFYSLNSNLTLVGEYNVNTISLGALEEETNTIALGAVINF